MAKILVVDDEPNLRRLYRRVFERDGHLVATAGNATEAIRSFESDRPDLVVMDLRMPDMDGLDLMARLLHRDPKAAIVLNSAYSCHRDNFLSWAAEACVIKSSDTRELRDTVLRILDIRRPSATASVA